MAVASRLSSVATPREERPERPQLVVIEGGTRHFLRRVSALALVSGLLLSVVMLRVNMASQQLKLDKLNYDVSRARQHFDSLRARRASLQSPEYLIPKARGMGMVQSIGTLIVDVPASIAAEVASTVGTVDADVMGTVESPLDEFGRIKASVEGAP